MLEGVALCSMPKQALMMLLHTLHIYGLEILARQIRQANCQAGGRRHTMSLNAVDPWGRKMLQDR